MEEKKSPKGAFPVAYIQMLVNKLDTVPLCKCLYEVLLAANILKKKRI